jgi:hypothetical protein
VDKYGRTRQATNDKIIRRMRFACWMTKTTDTFRNCNSYCFSTAIMVTLTRPKITFIRILRELLCFLISFSKLTSTYPQRMRFVNKNEQDIVSKFAWEGIF